MKKFVTILLIVIVVIICAMGAGVLIYAHSSDYKSDTLPDNITINGIDCSGLTYDQAKEKLTDEWNKNTLAITGQFDDQIATFTDFGCTYDIDKSIKKVKKQYLLFSAANHYFHTPVAANITMKIDKASQSFKDRVASSSFLDNEEASETRDAYVDLTKEDFPIVKELYGTKTDVDKFFNDILYHIQTGDFKFIFNATDYYSMPAVTSDNEELLEYQKFCQTYLTQKITYSMGDETFTISAEDLNGMMKDDMSAEADEDGVKAYVEGMASKYDNIGSTRKFTTLSGKKVTLEGGTYGWQIDQEGEAEQLTEDINSHKDVTREPVYTQQGYGEYTKTVGDTYIDADITKQEVIMYKGGKQVFKSSCVTGCKATGHTTHTGMYYVLNKVRDVVLKGDDGDGTEYESPVKYWLGVTWDGQGFHDADWRSSFGGDIWKTNGSHGCINMPPKNMPEMYDLAEVGMPILLHY